MPSGTPQGLERLVTSDRSLERSNERPVERASVDPVTPPRATPPGRLSVSVIGAGRVGCVLGAALSAVQHDVVGVTAVSEESRERAAVLLPGVRIVSPLEACELADLVLVTVPDDVLPDLVQGLANADAWRSGQLVAHTSGRHGLAALAGATDRGAIPLAMHPVMTFTGTSLDVDRLHGSVFGVTAPSPFLPIADALVIEVGGEPVHVLDEQRVLYHAALAHAANHLVTLVASSAELLTEAGVDNPGKVLRPLLTAALDNTLREGDAALTGPVARGDVGTVSAHIDAIGAAAPETLRAYLALAHLTARRAQAAGRLTTDDAESMLNLLATQGGIP